MNVETVKDKKVEVATLAGGCFWCTEAAFSIIKGVEKVEPQEPLGMPRLHR
jgi:peptide methionine sulfoxide reductase MsrA